MLGTGLLISSPEISQSVFELLGVPVVEFRKPIFTFAIRAVAWDFTTPNAVPAF